jgi:hypothetical protein
MKKILTICAIFWGVVFYIHGQDSSGGTSENSLYNAYIANDDDTDDKNANAIESSPSAQAADVEKSGKAALSTGKRGSRRYFELGILNLRLGLIGLDIGNMMNGELLEFNGFDPTKINGFSADTAIFTNPIYFKISVRGAFDLDFFTGADFKMNFDIPEKTTDALANLMDMVNTPPPNYDPSKGVTQENLTAYKSQLDDYMKTLKDIDAGMSASASMFAEMGMGVSRTILDDRLYIRAAPSLFFTLLYMEHRTANLKSYESKDKKEYGLQGYGSMKLYSAWDLDGDVNPFASPGVDLTLEACYALLPILDTGISVSHIPLIPSTLNYGKSIDVSGITMNVKAPSTPDDLAQIIKNPDSAVNINIPDPEDLLQDSDDENRRVVRPTRFDFYALVKPFKSPLLVVRPNLGFTINSIIAPALFNWELDVQFNAPTIFSAFVGSGLTENIWVQRTGIMLDFRAFEVDIAAALTGKTFIGCFSDQRGLSLGIGFKVGF